MQFDQLPQQSTPRPRILGHNSALFVPSTLVLILWLKYIDTGRLQSRRDLSIYPAVHGLSMHKQGLDDRAYVHWLGFARVALCHRMLLSQMSQSSVIPLSLEESLPPVSRVSYKTLPWHCLPSSKDTHHVIQPSTLFSPQALYRYLPWTWQKYQCSKPRASLVSPLGSCSQPLLPDHCPPYRPTMASMALADTRWSRSRCGSRGGDKFIVRRWRITRKPKFGTRSVRSGQQ